jgi:hypothetical protein
MVSPGLCFGITHHCALSACLDCANGAGSFVISAAGSLTVQGADATIHAWSMDLSGPLSTGANSLFVHSCAGRNFVLGGASTSSNALVLTGNELQLITADILRLAASGNITVLAVTGVQSQHVARVSLDSAETVEFLQPSDFTSLDATSKRTMVVNATIVTNGGDLDLTSSAGGINFARQVDLLCAGAVVVSSPGLALVTAPAQWQAASGVNIVSQARVLGSGVFSIWADTNSDGVGTLTIAAGLAVASSAVTELTFRAADYSIQAAVQATAADLSLDASGKPASTFKLGPSTLGDCVVDQGELNLLLTTGALVFGGNLTQSFELAGVTQTAGPASVELAATQSSTSAITVTAASSLTAAQIALVSYDGISVDAALTLAGTSLLDGKSWPLLRHHSPLCSFSLP